MCREGHNVSRVTVGVCGDLTELPLLTLTTTFLHSIPNLPTAEGKLHWQGFQFCIAGKKKMMKKTCILYSIDKFSCDTQSYLLKLECLKVIRVF